MSKDAQEEPREGVAGFPFGLQSEKAFVDIVIGPRELGGIQTEGKDMEGNTNNKSGLQLQRQRFPTNHTRQHSHKRLRESSYLELCM